MKGLRRVVPLLAMAFFVGVLLTLWINSGGAITFDPSFSFGHLLSAVTTILVAVLVTAHLQRQTATNRAEKDLLLRYYNNLAEIVSEFEKYRDGGVLTEITAWLKRVSLAASTTRKILVSLKYPPDVLDKAKFDDLIKKARKHATETPIKKLEEHAARPECDSIVREGIITLATENKALLESTVEQLKARIIAAQIAINRC
jgi:hypothetical protein